MSELASVTISDCKKHYDRTAVIHGVNLRVEESEFVVLVGPSGCGKSTILRMIAGLEDVTEGEIRIGDRVVNRVPPKDRDVAMVFQNYALYPHLTVFANMAFGLMLRGEKKDTIRARVSEAAEILGLEEYLERYPKQLSGGQRQRVAIGRAMVRKPKVFLFDEPLSNLDAKLRVQMRTELKALQRKLRTTTIYVTHDQIEAMTLADRVVVLNQGRLMQIGAPLKLYDRPANLFVADFIGSPTMNILPGRSKRSGAAPTVALDAGTELSLKAEVSGRDGQAVMVGIRPEHLAVEPRPASNVLSAVINLTEPTGADTLVMASVGGQEVCCSTSCRITQVDGEPLTFYVLPEHLHVFDAKNGQRLPGAQ